MPTVCNMHGTLELLVKVELPETYSVKMLVTRSCWMHFKILSKIEEIPREFHVMDSSIIFTRWLARICSCSASIVSTQHASARLRLGQKPSFEMASKISLAEKKFWETTELLEKLDPESTLALAQCHKKIPVILQGQLICNQVIRRASWDLWSAEFGEMSRGYSGADEEPWRYSETSLWAGIRDIPFKRANFCRWPAQVTQRATASPSRVLCFQMRCRVPSAHLT